MAYSDTHSKAIGYLLWIFGFMGAHRFYYGKPITGTLWFFTLGFFLIGCGPVNFNLTWVLLTFLGIFGLHRLYMGKWITAILYFFTGGLFLLGVLYDYWTLNEQISTRNMQREW